MKPIQSTDISALKAFVGSYMSEELHTIYEVKLENEQLYLSHVRNGKVHLKRVWNDGFETNANYAPLVGFQRNSSGDVVSFTASTYRSRNQKFTKLK